MNTNAEPKAEPAAGKRRRLDNSPAPRGQKMLVLLVTVIGVLAMSVFAVACGDDSDDPATTPMEDTTTPNGMSGMDEMGDTSPTETGAANLRADLTHLLTEHVELAGIAVNTGLGAGLDSPEFEAAAGVLDENSVDLADAVGGIYDDAAGDQFLELWRAHIGMFVDYAEGKATGNKMQAEGALADLDGYREDFGAFIASANPELPKEAVAEELKPHVETLAAAIDALAEGDASAFAKLQTAASHMPHTAETLAGGFVAQNPEMFDGDPASPASTLRSDLTYLLDQHVYAAAIAINTGLAAGLDSPEFEAAAGALDDNSVALADAVGGVYDDAAGDQFLELWRAHIGMFVDYTEGVATDNKEQADAAKADLDGYREDFGAFLASANPELTKEAVAEELIPHVDSVLVVIDSAAAGDAAVFANLREAASHMPHTAGVLAAGWAAQFPDMFGDTSAGNDDSDAANHPTGHSAGGDGSQADGDAAANAVTIKTFAYDPSPIMVAAGDTVTWTNEDEIFHSVTYEGNGMSAFDGQLDGAGTTFEQTFDDPGEYAYICTAHNGMNGVVVVE